MNRPHIVVLITSNARRGAEVFGSQLVEGLTERGWRTSLVALGPAPTNGATVDADVIGSSVAGLDPRLVKTLRRRLRGVDVVLANGGATLRYAVAATTLMRSRPLVVYGSIGEPMYWVRSPSHLRLLRLQLSRCDAVVAVSEATRRQLVSQVGIPADHVDVASTGVSSRWCSIATDPAGDPMRMVWIGSLSAEKDPLLASVAFARARLTEGAELRFVGDGPLRIELTEGAPAGVTSVGSVTDVSPHLEWARCLVLSSKTEGLPGVVLEAMGAGLPVIATRVGGVTDVVIDGETGLTVDPGDSRALAEAMERLDGDAALRTRMGSAARSMVAERYLFEHSFDRYDAVLRRRLGERSA